jgi:hypothetical protein
LIKEKLSPALALFVFVDVFPDAGLGHFVADVDFRTILRNISS